MSANKALALVYWIIAAFLLWTLSMPAPEDWQWDWVIWVGVGMNIIAGVMNWKD